jgi:hypothetical protein
VTYLVQRTMIRTLKGKRLHFQLICGADRLLHTKLKSESPALVLVSKGESMHFSDRGFAGAILVQDRSTLFVVKASAQDRDALARIAFSRKASPRRSTPPRRLAVEILGRPSTPRLASKRPTRGPVGNWTLDFGGRPVVPSVKNAILIDPDNAQWCAVAKTGPDVLRVDVVEAVDPLIAFGIGVSSYLCKLR